ncbi:MAG: hypothetical protein AUG44_24280 [Actinobacteria bacterium 13_1_20CM_3_71_11]|nr:MAG: hypothetical protein AUG44_24280 [Actinobacteria bacterium 13_1_20CM_3_71_11]
MSTLEDWIATVCAELDVDPVDTTLVLDLARDVAHGVARPAAPLTAYLLGLAVGRGADARQAAAAVTALATSWPGAPKD